MYIYQQTINRYFLWDTHEAFCLTDSLIRNKNINESILCQLCANVKRVDFVKASYTFKSTSARLDIQEKQGRKKRVQKPFLPCAFFSSSSYDIILSYGWKNMWFLWYLNRKPKMSQEYEYTKRERKKNISFCLC